MRSTMMVIVLAGAGCGGLSASDAARLGLKEVQGCDDGVSLDDAEPRLVTGCTDDTCATLSITLEPGPGPSTWTVDGEVVADGACGIELDASPGKQREVAAKGPDGRVWSQVMKTTAFDTGNLGDPGLNTVIYGGGAGCNFWVVMLGGCLYVQEATFMRRKFYPGNLSSNADEVENFGFLPMPSPGVDERGYADWIRWTLYPDGQVPPGVLPPESVGGSDPYLSHGFGLYDMERALLYVMHGQESKWEYLDQFWCAEGTGGIGNMPGQ